MVDYGITSPAIFQLFQRAIVVNSRSSLQRISSSNRPVSRHRLTYSRADSDVISYSALVVRAQRAACRRPDHDAGVGEELVFAADAMSSLVTSTIIAVGPQGTTMTTAFSPDTRFCAAARGGPGSAPCGRGSRPRDEGARASKPATER